MKLSQVNDKLASHATDVIGTMYCFYIFAAWALVPLFWPEAQSTVSYVSQAFIQLVLLPVIMVGQRVQARKHEERDIVDHDALMEELSCIRQLVVSETTTEMKLDEILALTRATKQEHPFGTP